MNVVDSSAWLEYFAEGPNAGAFAKAIEDISRLAVPTIILLEVFKRILVQSGEEEALEKALHMKQGLLVPLDEGIAIEAARIGREWKLPLADSVILATARLYGATLWTQDADFAGMEGVWYYPKRKPEARG